MQIILGFLLSAAIGYSAWRAGALSPSGAWAAFLTGGLIFGFGGLAWAALLLAFFISSSALSRAFSRQKSGLSEKFSKGSQRDWGQVFANGGLGALLAVVHGLFPGLAWPWVAYAGAMAAVNADTWATEIGVLSQTPPRLITNWKRVERGTSGGITPVGTFASLAGAALVAGVGAAFNQQSDPMLLILVATLGGLGGSLFDSTLGATIQAIYWCPACQKETERHPVHLCGCETQHLRGWRWFDNDVVNFASSVFGALITLGLWQLRP